MDKPATIVKSIRMSVELANDIELLAQKQNRNFSNMCETLLKKLTKEELKHQLTLN